MQYENYGLAFLILLNSAAVALLVSEYRRSNHTFLKFVVLGQFAAVCWHIAVAWLMFDSSLSAFIVAYVALTMSSVSFLHASIFLAGARPIPYLNETSLVLFSVAALAIATTRFTPLFYILGMLALAPMCVAPWYTLKNREISTARTMTILQISIAFFFGVGILVLLAVAPMIGGFMYFAMAMLVPAMSVMFFQSSLEMSTREMKINERKFRELFDSVRDIVYRVDSSGVIKEVSPSVRQLGYEPHELIGESLATLYACPEQFEADRDRILGESEIGVLPLLARTHDGKNIECELSANTIVEDDRVTALVGTIRDVDERNQLERQFLEAQRRESLGVLAGGVAHDFNNLLQGIVGHADWLMMDPSLDETERKRHLSVILDASNTAATLCRQLLEYTGKSSVVIEPVHLAETVADVADILKHSLSSDIVLDATATERHVVVDADATQIRQVILNLIKNAADAIGDTGTISVTVDARQMSGHALRQVRSEERVLPGGEYACIQVSDTGVGIERNVLDRIFDPFYSTKSRGHGLGLAAVTGIVRSHDGGIKVESSPGKGSTFSVFLPLSAECAVEEHDAGNIDPDGDGKVVLVADDEPEIRSIATWVLEDQGYYVMTAADGVEAVNLFFSMRNSIAAVVMDVKMPNKDGLEAIRDIRKLDDSIPIVVASGYADVATRITSSEAVRFDFLPKPYRGKELLGAINEAISRAESAA